MKTGIIAEQILEGETGTIHYSYYLPEDYDTQKKYPLMMVMPGYDMMWFGGESSGSNLDWDGFLCWTQLQEDMIVVSAQLTDWHDTSAWQAIELTEYFLANFSVDVSRVYAAGYSAGGETMSQAVPMRRTSMQPISTEHLSGMGTMRPLRKMARLSIFLWQNMMSIMVPSGHGVLTTVSMMPMRKLDGARSRSAMFFRSRHQMTNGSFSGALPAIIMAAAMWFLGNMMF